MHSHPHSHSLPAGQDPAVTRQVLDYMLFMNSKVLFKHLRHDQGRFESHKPVSVHVNVRGRGTYSSKAWAGLGPCWAAHAPGLSPAGIHNMRSSFLHPQLTAYIDLLIALCRPTCLAHCSTIQTSLSA